MRERVTSVVEVVSLASIVAGFGLWLGVPAALIVAGVLGLAVTFLAAR